MSNYHIRSIRPDGRSADVVFHVPVPVENNSASISLNTALSEHVKRKNENGTFSAFESVMSDIDVPELADLRSGLLYEHAERVNFLANDTNPQKQAKINNRYTALSVAIPSRLRAVLRFWGLGRDV